MSHTHVHARAHALVRTHVHARTHTHAHTHAHARAHTHTYTHAHTHTQCAHTHLHAHHDQHSDTHTHNIKPVKQNSLPHQESTQFCKSKSGVSRLGRWLWYLTCKDDLPLGCRLKIYQQEGNEYIHIKCPSNSCYLASHARMPSPSTRWW